MSVFHLLTASDVGTVVNKTTFQVLTSVNTPDYDPSQWVINPASLSALLLAGTSSLYWKVSVDGLDILEQSASEKAATNSNPTNIANARAAQKASNATAIQNYINGKYSADTQAQFQALSAKASGDNNPGRKAYAKSLFDWIDQIQSHQASLNTAIDNAGSVTAVQAIVPNLTPYDATDPGVTIVGAQALTTVQGPSSGIAIVDFGAFPGKTGPVSVAVTGLMGIQTSSTITVRVRVQNATAQHNADEHLAESLELKAGNVVPDVGFTIYASVRTGRAFGTFNINWNWS